MPEADETISFVSDRQSVTLKRSEILYIESCDTEVWIHAMDGRKFRNKTPISAWANLLGNDFLHIHRSYLVRFAACSVVGADTLTIGEDRLPVSRKYKAEVARLIGAGLPTSN